MPKTTGFEKRVGDILNRPLVAKETGTIDIANEKSISRIVGSVGKRYEDDSAEHPAEVMVTPVRRINLSHGK